MKLFIPKQYKNSSGIYMIYNIVSKKRVLVHKIAKDNNLSMSSLLNLVRGERMTFKGWILKDNYDRYYKTYILKNLDDRIEKFELGFWSEAQKHHAIKNQAVKLNLEYSDLKYLLQGHITSCNDWSNVTDKILITE